MNQGLPGTAADLVWLTLALPLAGFVLNGALAIWAPGAKRTVSAVGVGALVATFGVAVLVFRVVAAVELHDPYVVTLWSWMAVGSLAVDVALQVDQLSLVMLLVVTGVGSLIHVFSVGYMRDDPGYARYFAYLNLFVFFMLTLVLGANFVVMFVGWEGVGLCSYLLIGFWFADRANANAGKKAFIMNRIGDFGFLLAMFIIWWQVRTLDFAAVFARAPGAFTAGGGLITAVTLLLFLGCTGKSAQIPLYTWLPDAMAGPTPVSALIHAATMVTAGVYLVARCSVLFALAPVSSSLVAGIGAVTAIFAATIALRQWDIKKVLAYSTVSQLGYMFLGVGSGAYTAGIFHLVTHAFFKALLFLGSGSVIHALHHAYHTTHNQDDAQDMRNMGGLRRHMPWTFGLMWVATLAIAGIPGLSGFFSKDEILAAAFARGATEPVWYVYWGLGAAAAVLTAFYMARLMIYTFHGPNRTGEIEREHLHEAPWIMTGPLLVLGALTVVGGALNLPTLIPLGAQRLHHWLEPVMAAAGDLVHLAHVSHGVEIVLLIVASLIAVGGIIAAFRILKPESLRPATQAEPETGWAKLLAQKYYVDEIYDALIVRPLLGLSRTLLWKITDTGIIDGLGVNGAGRVTRGLGFIGSKLQTGSLGVYVTFFVAGVLWLLWRLR